MMGYKLGTLVLHRSKGFPDWPAMVRSALKDSLLRLLAACGVGDVFGWLSGCFED